jgi:hypothetical protein
VGILLTLFFNFTIMNCLTDYIGLRGCTDSEPLSGLYINDLAGINLKSIDATADNEQVTYLGVWAAVQKRAQVKLLSAVQREFNKRYKLKTITQSWQLPKDLNGTEETFDPTWKGLQIDTSCGDQIQYVQSNLMFISVQSFSVYIKSFVGDSITINYQIADGFTGEVFTSGTKVITSTGWHQININEKYFTSKLDIEWYAPEGTVTEQVDLNDTDGVGCACMSNLFGCDCCASVWGLNQGDRIDGNSWGMIVTSTIGCSFEGLICANKNTFDAAYWNLLGLELMIEQIYTDRLNKYTTIRREEAKELRDYYQVEFDKYIEQAIEGISMDNFDCCLECNENYQYQTSRM